MIHASVLFEFTRVQIVLLAQIPEMIQVEVASAPGNSRGHQRSEYLGAES